MSNAFLRENFPLCPAFVAIHDDTEHRHAHIYVHARQLDDRKTNLGQDYFQYDAAKHLLRGDRTGVRYQLGGRVTVKVVRVNLEQAKIDFVLVEEKPVSDTNLPAKNPVSDTKKPRDIDKKMAKLKRYK